MYTCVADSLCCTAEKIYNIVSQLQSNNNNKKNWDNRKSSARAYTFSQNIYFSPLIVLLTFYNLPDHN